MNDFYGKFVLPTLNSKLIRNLNEYNKQNPDKKIYVEIPNTKGITSDLLRELTPNIAIRIEGAYTKEVVSRFENAIYTNGETGEYYTTAVIYTRNEAIQIISEMERIEEGMKSTFNDWEKLIYIYEKLKSNIMYDPKFEEKASSETRSLRGLVTKKTVCAGYAVIFKEMMDRQGIDCRYVSGKTKEGDGHAWNIVTIDRKNYPIDITWDNSNFRKGILKTLEYLGQDVEEFNKSHIPDDNEPYRHCILSDVSPEFVRRINNRFKVENEYRTTRFIANRKDGTRFMVVQIGDKKINGTQYYRYYYTDYISDNGNYTLANPCILYSESNITKYVDAKHFDSKIPEGYGPALINLLFSKENIQDSLQKGTGYIGKVKKDSLTNSRDMKFVESISEIEKPYDKQKRFQYPTKIYKRNDGSVFIAQKMFDEEVKVGRTNILKFDIFEVLEQEGKPLVQRNSVYTEKDFFLSDDNDIANIFLSRERLNRKSMFSGGYIGSYGKRGIKINNKLTKFFNNIHRRNLKVQINSREENNKADDQR